MPLTMKDIAAIFGVSESTVSRAINGKPGVSEKLREEILALAGKRQFRPNALAQGLAAAQSGMLGLILPDITHPHLTPILQGIEERASKAGYHLILANTGGCCRKEADYVSFFRQNRVEGVIFIGGSLAEEEILKLGLSRYPLVLVNRLVEEMELPTLLTDHEQGARLAVEHLLGQGHERIGLVVGLMEDLTNVQLLQGYRDGLAEAGEPFDEQLVVEVESSRTGGYEGLLRLLQSDDPPTAVFAAGEMLAVGVVEAIKLGGYLIPDDLAVVGYGDTEMIKIIDPPLTTVRLPLAELGLEAVDQLIRLIRKTGIGEPIRVLPSELIRRRSS